MSTIKITGGRALSGQIRVQGAKNSVLPIMAASILSGGETVIHNCPRLTDVEAAISILRHLGCRAELRGSTAYIDSSAMTRWDIPDVLMRRMRSSVIFLGAILARCHEARLSMPGGCELGPRPIDLHLSAMERLGAEITERGGDLNCRAGRLTGGRIDLAIPSVGATENAMIAASGAGGVTLITNAAREPEIRDLGDFLTAMGARVHGAGTSTVTVEGGAFREHTEHTVIPDRIAAATYIAALTAAGGDLTLTGVDNRDLSAVTEVFRAMGVELTPSGDTLRVRASGRPNPPGTVVTKPYPGFPTDAQPPLMAAALRAAGTVVFVETIFQNRYRHVPELARMGADIRLDGRVAIVQGVSALHGARVEATDLRGGAALVVAALAAQGETEITQVRHIDRGYENITDELSSVGAAAERIDGKDETDGNERA